MGDHNITATSYKFVSWVYHHSPDTHLKGLYRLQSLVFLFQFIEPLFPDIGLMSDDRTELASQNRSSEQEGMFEKHFLNIMSEIREVAVLVFFAFGIDQILERYRTADAVEFTLTHLFFFEIDELKFYAPFFEKANGFLGILAFFSAEYLNDHSCFSLPASAAATATTAAG